MPAFFNSITHAVLLLNQSGGKKNGLFSTSPPSSCPVLTPYVSSTSSSSSVPSRLLRRGGEGDAERREWGREGGRASLCPPVPAPSTCWTGSTRSEAIVEEVGRVEQPAEEGCEREAESRGGQVRSALAESARVRLGLVADYEASWA